MITFKFRVFEKIFHDREIDGPLKKSQDQDLAMRMTRPYLVSEGRLLHGPKHPFLIATLVQSLPSVPTTEGHHKT